MPAFPEMVKKVIPAILAADKKEFEKKFFVAKNFSLVQIDLCDGKFVKNKTVSPVDLVSFSLPRTEFHLMVVDVDHYVEHCVRLNAETIVFHVESCKNDAEVLHLIRHIKSHNVKVGIAVNPETGIARIKKFIKLVDQILVMTVHPGFGGQKFIVKMLPKIKALRNLNKKINIEVDGGINFDTIRLASKAGANMFVAGNAILNAKNPKKAYEELLNSVNLKV